MPTRWEMLKTIYQKIANKTLSFWRKVHYNPTQYIVWNSPWYRYDIYEEFSMPPIIENQSVAWYDDYYDDWIDNWKYKIIGSCVMIGDVMEYIDKSPDIWYSKFEMLISWGIWNNFASSIDKQKIDCIEYIYNLCK